MTSMFLILLIVLLLFVTFLPLRFIIFCSTFYKFYCGMRWQRKRTINNEEVCKIEMENFFVENKLVSKDFDETWESICRKIKDSDFN